MIPPSQPPRPRCYFSYSLCRVRQYPVARRAHTGGLKPVQSRELLALAVVSLSQGELEKIRVWFQDYKKPDGKPENKFGYNNKCMDKCARAQPHNTTRHTLKPPQAMLILSSLQAQCMLQRTNMRVSSRLSYATKPPAGSSPLGLSRRRTSSGCRSRTGRGRTMRSSRSTRGKGGCVYMEAPCGWRWSSAAAADEYGGCWRRSSAGQPEGEVGVTCWQRGGPPRMARGCMLLPDPEEAGRCLRGPCDDVLRRCSLRPAACCCCGACCCCLAGGGAPASSPCGASAVAHPLGGGRRRPAGRRSLVISRRKQTTTPTTTALSQRA